MEPKLLLPFLFFTFLHCFSQSEKTIRGEIVFNEIAVEKIDIVNLNSKKSSTTDSSGNFNIIAKVDDILFILSEEYYDIKVKVTQSLFDQNNIIINLEKKPIALDEVTVKKTAKVGHIVSPEEIAMTKITKFENSPKTIGVYTGEMPYGTDFVGIFKKIFGSKKKKDNPKNSKFSTFKDYLLYKLDQKEFFFNTLKIKPEELDLFIEFSQKDAAHKSIMQNDNILETIEFLIAKKKEFDALK